MVTGVGNGPTRTRSTSVPPRRNGVRSGAGVKAMRAGAPADAAKGGDKLERQARVRAGADSEKRDARKDAGNGRPALEEKNAARTKTAGQAGGAASKAERRGSKTDEAPVPPTAHRRKPGAVRRVLLALELADKDPKPLKESLLAWADTFRDPWRTSMRNMIEAGEQEAKGRIGRFVRWAFPFVVTFVFGGDVGFMVEKYFRFYTDVSSSDTVRAGMGPIIASGKADRFLALRKRLAKYDLVDVPEEPMPPKPVRPSRKKPAAQTAATRRKRAAAPAKS